MACQVSHSFCHVKSNTQLHICRQATLTYGDTFTLVVSTFASHFFQELYQATVFCYLQDDKEVTYVIQAECIRFTLQQKTSIFIYLFIF